MSSSFAVTPLIAGIGAIQCLFLITLLWGEGYRAFRANRWLILFLAASAVSLGKHTAVLFSYTGLDTMPVGLGMISALLLMPALESYCAVLTGGSPGRWPLRALPAILASCLSIPFFVDEPQAVIDRVADSFGLSQTSPLRIPVLLDISFEIVLAVQMAFSLFRIRQRLRRYAEWSEIIYGQDPEISLSWLRLVTTILSIIYFIFVGTHLLRQIIEFECKHSIAVTLAHVIAIYVLGFKGLTQPLLFLRPESGTSPAPTSSDSTIISGEGRNSSSRKPYARSGLSLEDGQVILARVEAVMSHKHLYLNPLLSLSQLAAHIGTTPNHLSQALNQIKRQSFFDYVNAHRIEAAKVRFCEKSSLSILDVAMEVGFNSKSTFNAAFKKFTGMTPSVYRHSQISDFQLHSNDVL